MIERIHRVLALLFTALVLGLPNVASAVVITYQSVDLADLVPGQDLWRYEYSVSGSFVPFGGFNVFFSPNLYSNLEKAPPQVNGDWSPAAVEPNLGLSANGFYSATALVSNPSLSDHFTLTFLWLGSGTPGSQPFEVFDDTFSIVQTGVTQSPSAQVSAPGTLLLLCIGFLTLAIRRARLSL